MTKDELRSLKDLLEIIKNKVDKMEAFQNVTMQQVRDIKDQQSVMNGKLDSHSEALVSIESKLDAYGDMYKINDSNVRKVERRTEALEDKVGVIPPQEHILVDAS